MIEITEQQIEENDYFLYIHTPFCGTCHLASSMLRQIEAAHKKDIFYDMNASLHESFMQEEQIESVPCLYIKKDGEVKKKIYTFHSVPNIYTYLLEYNPQILGLHDSI